MFVYGLSVTPLWTDRVDSSTEPGPSVRLSPSPPFDSHTLDPAPHHPRLQRHGHENFVEGRPHVLDVGYPVVVSSPVSVGDLNQ